MELEEGPYFILVFSHAVEGIRARRILEPVVWSVRRGEMLPAEVGERLLHLVQEQGSEWESPHPAIALPQETWSRMESEARARNRALFEAERRENEALYVRRRGLLDAEHEYDRGVKETRLKTAQARGRLRGLREGGQWQQQRAEAGRRESECLSHLWSHSAHCAAAGFGPSTSGTP